MSLTGADHAAASPPPEPIRAAGALLWRICQGVATLAVVHRRRYGGDWALPKGKLQTGESWRQAALREVREETGCEPELGPFAGAIRYLVDGRPKEVRFWHMRCLVEEAYPRDDEVAEVVWVSPEEAQVRLSYADERALLREALPHAPADWVGAP